MFSSQKISMGLEIYIIIHPKIPNYYLTNFNFKTVKYKAKQLSGDITSLKQMKYKGVSKAHYLSRNV